MEKNTGNLLDGIIRDAGDIINARNTRQFVFNGKLFISFTPHQGTDPKVYQNIEAFSCDLIGYITFRKHAKVYAISGQVEECYRRSYVENCLAQLYFNNYDIVESYEELCMVYTRWVAFWNGNDSVGDQSKNMEAFGRLIWGKEKEILKQYITWAKYNKHWYPMDVELIIDGAERFKKRAEIRNGERIQVLQNEFKSVAESYQLDFYDVLPTAKHQSDRVRCKINMVYKHGKDFFIDQKQNTSELIKAVREYHPMYTQKEVKDYLESLGIKKSIRTIKEYWKIREISSPYSPAAQSS